MIGQGGSTTGIGNAARTFLQQRLDETEARWERSPLGSVARAEAAQEAREIRRILDTDQEWVARIATGTTARGVPVMQDEEDCPSCRTKRVGSFRFCRSCGFDFDSSERPAPSRR